MYSDTLFVIGDILFVVGDRISVVAPILGLQPQLLLHDINNSTTKEVPTDVVENLFV